MRVDRALTANLRPRFEDLLGPEREYLQQLLQTLLPDERSAELRSLISAYTIRGVSTWFRTADSPEPTEFRETLWARLAATAIEVGYREVDLALLPNFPSINAAIRRRAVSKADDPLARHAGEPAAWLGRQLNNLAVREYLCHTPDRYSQAATHAARALAIAQPESPHSAAVSFYLLGHALRLLGDNDRAYRSARYAFELFRQTYGNAHYNTAMSLDSLALAASDLGGHDQAAALATEAAEFFRQFPCPNYPAALATQAIIRKRQGRRHEAAELSGAALRECKELLGPRHAYSAIALNLHAKFMDPETAYGLREEAQGIILSHFGPLSVEAAIIANNLGVSEKARGETERAAASFRYALQRFRSRLGPAHRHTTTATRNLYERSHARTISFIYRLPAQWIAAAAC